MKQVQSHTFLFTGGGTGGHLYPAIAIAEILKKDDNVSILFVGTKTGIESRIVPDHGFLFETVWIAGWKRGRILANCLVPLKMLVSFFQALSILSNNKPAAVIGTGGYVSWPVLAASRFLRKNIFLQEQNAIPGVVTRMMAAHATGVFLSFEASRKYFKRQDHLFLCGNPTRDSLEIKTSEEARKHFNLSGSDKVLFVFGGSQGARIINESLLQNLNELIQIPNLKIIWVTGPRWHGLIKEEIASFDDHIHLLPYLEDMSLGYKACDLILCRSGATTMAEITRLGVPAIFIPFAAAAGGHQQQNAEALVKEGAAGMILESEIWDKLVPEIKSCIEDDQLLKSMRKKCLTFGMPNATQCIIDIINDKIDLKNKREETT